MTTLKRGSNGEEVKRLQQALIDNGYSVGNKGVDGVYGKDTEAAVRKYQQDKNLKLDGIAGNETQTSLFGTNNSGTSASNSSESNSSANNATPMTNEEWRSALIREYQNYPAFDYDPNNDPLYQDALARYQRMGRVAMEDAEAAAAAKTGGYSNTYAQAVGQQEYNNYMQQASAAANDYYQLAQNAYNEDLSRLQSRLSYADSLYNQDIANQQAWQKMQNDYATDQQNLTLDAYQQEIENNLAQYKAETDRMKALGSGTTNGSGTTINYDNVDRLADAMGRYFDEENNIIDEEALYNFYENTPYSADEIVAALMNYGYSGKLLEELENKFGFKAQIDRDKERLTGRNNNRAKTVLD